MVPDAGCFGRVGASAAGLSGCAPCRLCRHGHSASIPHAFAPAALRAALASRDSPTGYPRRATLGAPRCRRIGPSSAPPRWTGRWRTRWHLLRQVVQMRAVLNAGSSYPSRPRRTVHGQPARHRYGASTPRLNTGAARCGGGVLACHWVVDLARVSGRAGAAFVRGCRAGPISLRCGSAQGVLVLL